MVEAEEVDHQEDVDLPVAEEDVEVDVMEGEEEVVEEDEVAGTLDMCCFVSKDRNLYAMSNTF